MAIQTPSTTLRCGLGLWQLIAITRPKQPFRYRPSSASSATTRTLLLENDDQEEQGYLTDTQWAKATNPGRFVKTVLWVARTGSAGGTCRR
jgi:hypothetical protein